MTDLWKHIGNKLHNTIVKMNIPIEDLPWVDGRLDTVKLMKTWKKGKNIEQLVDSTPCIDCGLKQKNCKCPPDMYKDWGKND